jgi:hypothetical protein
MRLLQMSGLEKIKGRGNQPELYYSIGGIQPIERSGSYGSFVGWGVQRLLGPAGILFLLIASYLANRPRYKSYFHSFLSTS